MAKEGMSVVQIRKKVSILKSPQEKIDYLQNIWKRKNLLSPSTKKGVGKILFENYGPIIKEKEFKGDFYRDIGPLKEVYNIYKSLGALKGKKKLLTKIGKLAEGEKDYNLAEKMYTEAGLSEEAKQMHTEATKSQLEYADNLVAGGWFYESGGIQNYKHAGLSTKEAYFRASDVMAKKGNYREAVSFLTDCMRELNAAEYVLGGSKEISSKIADLNSKLEKQEKSKKTIDKIVTSLIALGGIGTFFTLFPASKLASVRIGQQLAPPIQDFTIYVFLALMLGGLGYLAVRKIRRRISIPLSFK